MLDVALGLAPGVVLGVALGVALGLALGDELGVALGDELGFGVALGVVVRVAPALLEGPVVLVRVAVLVLVGLVLVGLLDDVGLVVVVDAAGESSPGGGAVVGSGDCDADGLTAGSVAVAETCTSLLGAPAMFSRASAPAPAM